MQHNHDAADITAPVRSLLLALAMIGVGAGWTAGMAQRAGGLASLSATAVATPAIMVGVGLMALMALVAGAVHPRWRAVLWKRRNRSAPRAPFWVRWTVLPGTRWLARRLSPTWARRLAMFRSHWIVAAPMLLGSLFFLVYSVVVGAVAPRTPSTGWHILQLIGIIVMTLAAAVLLPLACVLGRASSLALHPNPPGERSS